MFDNYFVIFMNATKCFCIDVICFSILDYIAKNVLSEARAAKSETYEKLVWLYEILALSFVSIIIYLVDHVPCVLIFLTSIAFLSTQIFGRLMIAEWWSRVKMWWEEHQQMRANMYDKNMYQIKPTFEDYRIGQNHYSQMGTSSMYRPVPMQHQMGLNSVPNYYHSNNSGDSFDVNSLNNQNYYSNQNRSAILYNTNNHKSHKSSSTSKAEEDTCGANLAVNNKKERAVQSSQVPHVSRLSHNSRNIKSLFPQAKSSQTYLKSIKRTISEFTLSHFAITGNSDVPVGLKNDGQNLCFINSIIQCLCRTPGLAAKLELELNNETNCTVTETDVLISFVELLNSCSKGANRTETCIDTSTFRKAVSVIRGSPVVSPYFHQQQQDSAEFLMWLLSEIQQILMKSVQRQKGYSDETEVPFRSDHIAYFESVYGKLTPHRVKELIAACRRDINTCQDAEGTNGICRLIDLEWFAFKQENNTVIDSTFSGQIINAYHCLPHSHISITTQPFNILSLPIAHISEINNSNIVRVEDCIDKYCQIESLDGVNGLQCSMCSSVRNTTPANHAQYSNRQKSSLLDSTINLSQVGNVSPIVSDAAFTDSGYYDNRFRTSTPVYDQSKRTPVRSRVQTHDGEHRCALSKTPDILVIQLSRFRIRGTHISKNHTPVKIPLERLSLESAIFDPCMSADTNYKLYNLYGICVHLGAESMDTGHYISYCKDNGTEAWYKFDDDVVTIVNINYELTTRAVRENSYILFYHRV